MSAVFASVLPALSLLISAVGFLVAGFAAFQGKRMASAIRAQSHLSSAIRERLSAEQQANLIKAIEENNIAKAKKIVTVAARNLPAKEREYVSISLEQPSAAGEVRYMRRLVGDRVAEHA